MDVLLFENVCDKFQYRPSNCLYLATALMCTYLLFTRSNDTFVSTC